MTKFKVFFSPSRSDFFLKTCIFTQIQHVEKTLYSMSKVKLYKGKH